MDNITILLYKHKNSLGILKVIKTFLKWKIEFVYGIEHHFR